jgi:short subunit dehydrogenase-like uncharacterized protein
MVSFSKLFFDQPTNCLFFVWLEKKRGAERSCMLHLLTFFAVAYHITTCIAMAPRKYDIVVWGSTGFTGQLTAKYLANTYPGSSLKWAMAGRSQEKMRAVQDKHGFEADTIVASLDDPKSIESLTSQTTTLISTAGPFAIIGTPVLQSCVKTSTNYVDITGEAPWVRKMIDAHHDECVSKGIKVVPCCGFDSQPSDLGCQMVVDRMLEKGITPSEVKFIMDDSKGGASGGTIASIFNIIESSSLAELKKGANPYNLNPRSAGTGEPEAKASPEVQLSAVDSNGPGYDSVFGKWTAPFIMQAVNTRVVNRSNALAKWAYGKNFLYTERTFIGGPFSAFFASMAMAFGGILVFFPWTRALLKRVVPQPGEGPSLEMQKNGYFTAKLWGKGVDASGKEVLVTAGIDARNGDPGYVQTAKMVAEAALCATFDKETAPATSGILTPATAFGPALRKRLDDKGINFFFI